jgi:diaminohydroxyphosphoribosylaminopyrimidine deaminase/5-amino-6-(5-phosphoribosylamino)uracil reductase
MWEALELASRGMGHVSPNPMVGCVVVRNGTVVGRGWHTHHGGSHAEVNALREAGAAAAGATLYVTLEPCCHDGPEKRTPPCVPLILAAKPARVVVAQTDPNPAVNGGGIKALRDAGITVDTGLMAAEAAELNRSYVSAVIRSRPYVTAKWAMTLDGKIATRRGDSKWISSEPSRQLSHFERAHHDAVAIGIGTVLADNPQLTARVPNSRQPLRIVIDPRLETPVASNLASSAKTSPVLLFAASDPDTAPAARESALAAEGVEIARIPLSPSGHLAWRDMLAELQSRRLNSLLIEGGGGVLSSAFEQRAIDRVLVFVAPLIIGGSEAISPVMGIGVPEIAHGVRLEAVRTQSVGPDILICGKATYPESGESASRSGRWPGFGKPR